MRFHSDMWVGPTKEDEVTPEELAQAVKDWAEWAINVRGDVTTLPEAAEMEAASAAIIDALGGWVAVSIVELLLDSFDDDQRMSIAEQLRPELIKLVEKDLKI